MKRLKAYETRKAWVGFTFILPWLIGAIFFFLRPFFNTLYYSFQEMTPRAESMFKFIGLANYREALFGDADFILYFRNSLTDMLYQVPFILVFSLIIAVVLNMDFRGRTFYRAVFFLPVIISSGVIITLIRGDSFTNEMLSGARSGTMFRAASLEQMLLQSGLGESIVTQLMSIVNNIFDLTWKSGVQILIFLAGLKTIPSSLYEVAVIEGANSWEKFWHITLRMLSPIIMVNVIYTIIDSFNDYQNPVIKHIAAASNKMETTYSAAMAWLYFLVVLVVIVAVFGILSRRSFSYKE